MNSLHAFWEAWEGTIRALAWIAGASVLLLTVLLIYVAYVILIDRKVWAAVHLRRGPNVVGPFGLLQSFADLLKFVLKEPIIPAGIRASSCAPRPATGRRPGASSQRGMSTPGGPTPPTDPIWSSAPRPGSTRPISRGRLTA